MLFTSMVLNFCFFNSNAYIVICFHECLYGQTKKYAFFLNNASHFDALSEEYINRYTWYVKYCVSVRCVVYIGYAVIYYMHT